MCLFDDYKPKYFKPEEFRNCTPSCEMSQMDPWLLSKLDELRDKVHMPIVINSAYRSPEYEKQMGRTGSSAHTLGVAVDIRCSSMQNRFKIVKAAIELGFSRIGIASTYIHLDLSLTHTDDIIWLYQ